MSQIINLKKLKEILISPNSRHKKKVLVTGCFDFLHQEHQKFLTKAKAQGDLLIVGLESDQRVRELKGQNRPLNSWQKRAKALVQLNEVNFIVVLPDNFGNLIYRTKVLQSIKPNILAISAHDPLKDQKEKECCQISCQVKVVHHYNPKISTTKLLTNDFYGL